MSQQLYRKFLKEKKDNMRLTLKVLLYPIYNKSTYQFKVSCLVSFLLSTRNFDVQKHDIPQALCSILLWKKIRKFTGKAHAMESFFSKIAGLKAKIHWKWIQDNHFSEQLFHITLEDRSFWGPVVLDGHENIKMYQP